MESVQRKNIADLDLGRRPELRTAEKRDIINFNHQCGRTFSNSMSMIAICLRSKLPCLVERR